MKVWFNFFFFFFFEAWGCLFSVNNKWCTKHFPRWRHWEIITSASAEMFVTVSAWGPLPKAWRVHSSWLLSCLCASPLQFFRWGCFGSNQHAQRSWTIITRVKDQGERMGRWGGNNGSFLSPIVSCKLLSEMTTIFSVLSLIAMFVRRVGFFKWSN